MVDHGEYSVDKEFLARRQRRQGVSDSFVIKSCAWALDLMQTLVAQPWATYLRQARYARMADLSERASSQSQDGARWTEVQVIVTNRNSTVSVENS